MTMTNRDQVRRDLRAGLLPVSEIASRAGCSVRTVYRIAAEPEQAASGLEQSNPKNTLSAIIAEFEEY